MISRRNHDPQVHRPRGRRPSIFFTAVIYPVVKVLRRSGSATVEPGSLAVPAVRWSVGFSCEAHGSGDLHWDPDTRRRFEGLPANRRPGGVDPGLGMSRGIRLSLAAGCDGRSGGDEETRTPDPLLAKEMLCQLSYVPADRVERTVVGVSGLEPETSALSGQCSNQLS